MKTYILAALLVLFSAPAFAGAISLTNGQGTWQSTQCPRPMPPPSLGLGGEASAVTMNTASENYGQFIAATQAYVNCLSEEAKADLAQTNQMITTSVQAQMNDAQNQVNQARAQMFNK